MSWPTKTGVTTTSTDVVYRFAYPHEDTSAEVRITPAQIYPPYNAAEMLASLDVWAQGVAADASTALGYPVTASRHDVLDDNTDTVPL